MTKQSFSSWAVGLGLLVAMLLLGACKDGSSGGGGATGLTDCGARGCSKLTASDGAEQDVFGWSLAVDGDVIVVGAAESENPNGSGAAYVYRFDGTNWVEEAKLVASDGLAEDHFGVAVSVDGEVVVVGAYGVDNGSDAGSAYVYRFDGTDWVEQAKLVASDGLAEDHFGWSVAVSEDPIGGDVIVVGAPAEDTNGPQAGAIYIYRFDGVDWIEERKLVGIPFFAGPGDFYGNAVAIDGDVIAVGSYLDDNPFGEQAGSFWVYRHDGVDWLSEGKFGNPDPAASDLFGFSLDVEGDVVAVGALLDNALGLDSGAAYIYRYDGAIWAREQKITPLDGVADDRFGGSVALDGSLLVVGAGQNDDGSGPKSGSVYVFLFDGASWVEQEKLAASDGAEGDDFGGAVASDGGVIVAGAIGDDENGSDAGSAYVTD